MATYKINYTRILVCATFVVIFTYYNLFFHFVFPVDQTNLKVNLKSQPIQIAVVSQWIGYMDQTASIVNDNHKMYAEKHNYSYILERNYIEPEYPMLWQKPFLLYNVFYNQTFLKQHAMENKEFDYILWIDFDAIIMNSSITIESLIDNAKTTCNQASTSLIIVGDYNAMFNAGIFILKRSEMTEQFFERWSKPKYLKLGWEDQGAAISILRGAELSDDEKIWKDKLQSGSVRTVTMDEAKYAQRYLVNSKWREFVCITSQTEMNSYPSNYKKGHFAIHFPGRGDKPSMLRKYLNEVV